MHAKNAICMLEQNHATKAAPAQRRQRLRAQRDTSTRHTYHEPSLQAQHVLQRQRLLWRFGPRQRPGTRNHDASDPPRASSRSSASRRRAREPRATSTRAAAPPASTRAASSAPFGTRRPPAATPPTRESAAARPARSRTSASSRTPRSHDRGRGQARTLRRRSVAVRREFSSIYIYAGHRPISTKE